MKYALAIFDLDGTILNTLDDLTDSTNYALKINNMPTRSKDEIRSFVGNGIHKLIERAVSPGSSKEVIDKVFKDMTSYYKEHSADKTKPYEGITECINKLHELGIKTAVVSNKVDYVVKDLCEMYFKGLFDAAVGDKPDVSIKPAPDLVNEVLKILGVDRTKTIYIGDSEVDYQTAVNANMPCISVTWGFRTREYLKEVGSTVFADKPEDIVEIITK